MSSVQCAVVCNAATDAISTVDSTRMLCRCILVGVRSRMATAMPCAEHTEQLVSSTSALQAASVIFTLDRARARGDSSAVALYGCSHGWRTAEAEAKLFVAQTCAKIAHKYLVARGTLSIARPKRRLSPVASSLAA